MDLRFFKGIIFFFFLFSSSFFINADDRPWLAVHDFSVSDELQEKGVTQWGVAGYLEGDMAKKSLYRIITRAKIAKVLKEKNISSSSNLDPSSMGDMIGAQYIVTGSLTFYNDELAMTAKLIDVEQEAGEIEKSYTLSIKGDSPDDAVKKLPELCAEMADRMCMTPGALFDQSLSYFNNQNYTSAANDFRDLKKQLPINQIKKLMAGRTSFVPLTDTALSTPGKLLDYALAAMRKGQDDEAAAAFHKIIGFQDVKSILEIDTLITEAEQKGQKQKIYIEESISKAVELIRSSKERTASKDPALMLDEASALLETLLYNSSLPLSRKDKRQIESLLKNIKDARQGVYQGPAQGKEFLIPGIDIALMPISKGTFIMGDENVDPDDSEADNPGHSVTISKPFWMGKYEVTIGQYIFFLNDIRSNSSISAIVNKSIHWSSDFTPINKGYEMKRSSGHTWGSLNQPMVGVNFLAAEEFCKWLTARERNSKRIPKGYVYRLPTEAEWEYACRGGTKTDYYMGQEVNEYSFDKYAWHKDNSLDRTYETGKKESNPWGLYDMYGNVWEWCYDWYGAYLPDEVVDPYGTSDSDEGLKVLRGGSFTSRISDMKSNTRYSLPYKTGRKNVGFRVVLAPEL